MARPLILAPVGAPFAWGEVEYRAAWAPGPGPVRSRTSLRLIHDHVASVEGEPRLIVFGLDTLAAYSRLDRRGRPVEGADCLPDPVEELEPGLQGPREYEGFTRRVADCLAAWFREKEGLAVEARALPGYGDLEYTRRGGSRARAAWRLSRALLERGASPMGSLTGLYLLHLAGLLEEAFQGGDGSLHVDLTHGVNYASYSLLAAAEWAARLYSASTGARVAVTVYNSEPYVHGARRLHVMVVKRETVLPRPSAASLVYWALEAPGRDGRRGSLQPAGLVASEGRAAGEVARRLSSLVRALNAPGWLAGASVVYGLPLLLAQAWALALESGLSEATPGRAAGWLLGLLPRVRVARMPGGGPPGVVVEHVAAPRPGHVAKLLSLAALIRYARLAAGRGGALVEERGSRLCGERRRVAVASLEGLDAITREMLAGPGMVTAMNEVSRFQEAAAGGPGGREYELAQKALREGIAEDLPRKRRALEGGLNMRVFAAHAGLTVEAITLEAGPSAGRGGGVRVYYDPCLLGRVEEVARGLVKHLAESLYGGQ